NPVRPAVPEAGQLAAPLRVAWLEPEVAVLARIPADPSTQAPQPCEVHVANRIAIQRQILGLPRIGVDDAERLVDGILVQVRQILTREKDAAAARDERERVQA